MNKGQSGLEGEELREAVLFFKGTHCGCLHTEGEGLGGRRLNRQEKPVPWPRAPLRQAAEAQTGAQTGEERGGGQHLLSVNLLPSRASPNVPVTSARTLGTHRGRILGSRLPMSAPRPNLVVENRQ